MSGPSWPPAANPKKPSIGAIRTIYYLPAAVSGVAVSLLWLWIFQPSGGLANGLLELIGLSGTNWVYSTTWVIPASS